MAELQTIPARHGTATFVPAGQIIKIINSSGSQVVDTWAFALPKPEPKKDSQIQEQKQDGEQDKDDPKQDTSQRTSSRMMKKSNNLPSQEEAEQTTQRAMLETSTSITQKKSSWSSYMPSKVWPSLRKDTSIDGQPESEQQRNSRTWASYFPTGQGFSNYIPKTASDTVSAFAASHKRDLNKSYLEQLQDLSKTPVGAAGWSALTGSGWGGSTLAGYQAWNAQNAADAAPMEYMSMTHSRAAMLHLRPRVDDTLVSNLREPILTLVEDSSNGIHDTLIAACDPARYKGLGVENWEEHGSCAQNLVLALKELNERAGLKGAKAVGADVTINSVPAPLNLFMNIPWDEQGDIAFDAPKSKKDDYVRFKAERDVVVVMSACPQDILLINNQQPTDAHFIVESDEESAQVIKRTQIKKRPRPKKISSSHATSTVGTESGALAVETAPASGRDLPQKRPNSAVATSSATTDTQTKRQPPRKKPVPPPVAPRANDSTATPAASTPVATKKRPRKLNPKPAQG